METPGLKSFLAGFVTVFNATQLQRRGSKKRYGFMESSSSARTGDSHKSTSKKKSYSVICQMSKFLPVADFLIIPGINSSSKPAKQASASRSAIDKGLLCTSFSHHSLPAKLVAVISKISWFVVVVFITGNFK
jgi:hypothetical protein